MTLQQKHPGSRKQTQRTNILLWCLIMAFFGGIGYWFMHKHTYKPVPVASLNMLMSQVYADTGPVGKYVAWEAPLVLCYHQVRDWDPHDSKNDRAYIVPVRQFREQMQWLHDNGYHTILPEQWAGHLQQGTPLPGKPFLLTFDDGTQSQYDNALPELDRYGYKALFFIMTVTLDRPRFMSSKEIRYLSDQGHLIGCHTWDHHNVLAYGAADWRIQLVRPTKLLEQITGKPVQYFAYPFGSWDQAAIVRLKAQGYHMAFQLGGGADTNTAAFTVRRILVDGHWNTAQMAKAIALFHNR